jgi:hypothetical protein
MTPESEQTVNRQDFIQARIKAIRLWLGMDNMFEGKLCRWLNTHGLCQEKF